MENKVYIFKIDINWELIGLISKIDRFDASWSSIEKREGQSLKQLKSISTVRSVGASTRIEGSKMSDAEVDVLLKNIDITKLEDRDSQEVVGYFNTLDLITESYQDINITESSIKNLHNILLKHSKKDSWHKGNYKQHSNAVEANYPDGTKRILFETTEAGFPTEDAMRNLFKWYKTDKETHPLVKCASFCYEFVSIHPFQDGNGRLSRLIASLLLLKNGYKWIQYVSFEHEIESKKEEYYRVLRNCQSQRPNENITEWISFFFNSLLNIQNQLLQKLESSGLQSQLSPKEKSILTFIGNHSGCKSGNIAKKLDIPNPTVKRILSNLIERNLIEKHGNGPGTNYSLK
ncbi:MAG TPA: Fic family protein [Bacteroidales bacterium]|nr:Fic family protein [Bacteroidales bacterium]HOR82512.1 Fic family protein [Bacteroidales bacterium]HPJ91246.1 Fic family protein [Bacteroidales bacterium]